MNTIYPSLKCDEHNLSRPEMYWTQYIKSWNLILNTIYLGVNTSNFFHCQNLKNLKECSKTGKSGKLYIWKRGINLACWCAAQRLPVSRWLHDDPPSGLVERRPAPRRGFRGGCCQPTVLHRLCRQTNNKMSTCRRCWPFVDIIRMRQHSELREVWCCRAIMRMPVKMLRWREQWYPVAPRPGEETSAVDSGNVRPNA